MSTKTLSRNKEIELFLSDEKHRLSTNVRDIRKSFNNLSQQDFAYACGLSIRAISDIERKKRISDSYTLAKICLFANKQIKDLFK